MFWLWEKGNRDEEVGGVDRVVEETSALVLLCYVGWGRKRELGKGGKGGVGKSQ